MSDGTAQLKDLADGQCAFCVKKGATTSLCRGFARRFLVGGLYLLLLLVLTWPLVSRMTTHVATGDHSTTMVVHLNLWTLAWNHHWLDGLVSGEQMSYWDANNFAPHKATLAYSEAQFGTSLLSWPLYLAKVDHVLAYNLLHLGFMWGGAVAMYLLVARVAEDLHFSTVSDSKPSEALPNLRNFEIFKGRGRICRHCGFAVRRRRR